MIGKRHSSANGLDGLQTSDANETIGSETNETSS